MSDQLGNINPTTIIIEATDLATVEIIVNTLSDLPTPSAGKYALLTNTKYLICASLNISTNYLELAENTTVEGLTAFIGQIIYTGTGGAIRCIDKSVSLQRLTIVPVTAGGKAWDFVNAGKTKTAVIQEVIISSQNTQANVTGFDVVLLQTVNFKNTTNGLIFSGGDKLYLIQLGFDQTNTGTFVSIPSGSYKGGVLTSSFFDVASGSTAFNLNSATTFTSSLLVNGNIFMGAGTRITGHVINTYFDVEYKANDGVINSTAAISYYWANNGGTYTQNGNAYDKITGGTSIASNQTRFTHTTPNRATYVGKKPIKVKVNLACTLDYNSGSAYIGDIAVFKNGIFVASSVNGITVYANEEPVASNLQIDLVQNDYMEIHSYKYGAGSQTVKATFLNVQINEVG